MQLLLTRKVPRERPGEADCGGVVDADVEPAEMGHGALDRRGHRSLVAHIDHEWQGAAAGSFDCLCGGVNRSGELRMWPVGLGGDGDVGAIARGPQRDREPDATARPGDEKRLSIEAHGASLPGGQLRHGRRVRSGVRSPQRCAAGGRGLHFGKQ
jgi:hypothetical protein